MLPEETLLLRDQWWQRVELEERSLFHLRTRPDGAADGSAADPDIEPLWSRPGRTSRMLIAGIAVFIRPLRR